MSAMLHSCALSTASSYIAMRSQAVRMHDHAHVDGRLCVTFALGYAVCHLLLPMQMLRGLIWFCVP